jgi:type II secretory pathway pseudopilin PulG
MRPEQPNAETRPTGQEGYALLEVLVAGVVQGIALTGLALMFSLGQVTVVGQGDERVALYLAQQKIEEARSLGFFGIAMGSQTDTVTAGETGNQTFTRVTCTTYVSDTNLGEPPAGGCPAGATTGTKRVKVTVTPTQRQTDAFTLETVLTTPP